MFLSAGGAGERVEKNRSLGRMALDYGGVRLVGIDELAAAGSCHHRHRRRRARFRQLGDPAARCDQRRAPSVERSTEPPRGVICGHVPGFNAWLVSAALGLDYVDLASNGRGHPTVKMGGMGLASRPDLSHHTGRGERRRGGEQ